MEAAITHPLGIYAVLGNTTCLLVLVVTFFLLKATILCALLIKNRSARRVTAFLLCLVIVASMMENFAWILKLARQHGLLDFLPRQISFFCVRLAWGFVVVEAQALTLFIDRFVRQPNKLPYLQRIFIPISTGFFLFFVFVGVIDFNGNAVHWLAPYELWARKLVIIYSYFPLTVISILSTIYLAKKIVLPVIIKKQLVLIICFILLPYWMSNAIQTFPFEFTYAWVPSSYALMNFSNVLLIAGAFICTYRLKGLRFLNLWDCVMARKREVPIEQLVDMFSPLDNIQQLSDVNPVAQQIWKREFRLPQYSVQVHTFTSCQVLNSRSVEVEAFLVNQKSEVVEQLKERRVLVYDEIVYDNFYQNTLVGEAYLHLLKQLNADIFLPFYNRTGCIGYLLVERGARPTDCYTDVETSLMIMVAYQLADKIARFVSDDQCVVYEQKNSELLDKVNHVENTLYQAHQENDFFRQSTRSFLRSTKYSGFGLMFYKQNQYIFANEAAKELIQINPNALKGHPLALALKKLVDHISRFKVPYSLTAHDDYGKALVFEGFVPLDYSHFVIIVHYPELSDVVKQHMDLLPNPAEWHYVLYLETTQSGRLVNQLIPGVGTRLLALKIQLLKLALSKKAVAMVAPDADTPALVELVHQISLREKLHILNLESQTTHAVIATKLFGIHPLYAQSSQTELSLCELLDTVGTLCIRNIHFLDKQTQLQLAQLLRCGTYTPYKSRTARTADVRVIVSTDQNLKQLVQENKFCKELFDELHESAFVMPDLISLPGQELAELARGIARQLAQGYQFAHMLELKDHETMRLIGSNPKSLHILKTRITDLITRKAHAKAVSNELYVDETDSILADIARLGKNALQDKQALQLLWDKFKCENKMANFLGVHRSSINRRCKEHGIVTN